MSTPKNIHRGSSFTKFLRQEGIYEAVDEVRRAREKHAAKFKFDLKAIVEDAKQRQWQSGHQALSFAKNKSEQNKIRER